MGAGRALPETRPRLAVACRTWHWSAGIETFAAKADKEQNPLYIACFEVAPPEQPPSPPPPPPPLPPRLPHTATHHRHPQRSFSSGKSHFTQQRHFGSKWDRSRGVIGWGDPWPCGKGAVVWAKRTTFRYVGCWRVYRRPSISCRSSTKSG